MVILLGYLNKMGRYAAIDAERTFKYRGGEAYFLNIQEWNYTFLTL